MRKVFIFIFVIYSISSAFGQVKTKSKIKVFQTCSHEWLCDLEYLRNELKMVDFVRDRFLCDVQVILNTQFNNAGGEINTISFQGQNDFAAIKDTLSYFNNATATEDVKRRKMLQNLKLGLMQFIAKSPIAEDIEIKYTADTSDNIAQKKSEPWNYWQFSMGASGFFDGNKNYKNSNVSAFLSASRETEKNRFNFYANNQFNRSSFTIYYKDGNGIDTSEVVNVSRDAQNIESNYAQKLSDHWAVGLSGLYVRSVFDNIDARIKLAPSVEYSIFSYKDFNTQRIVLSYELGPQFSNYRDTTIYFKSQELLLQQSLGLITSFTKPWGSVNIGTFYTSYLDDLRKNNFYVGGGISWNVVKGLKVGIGGNIQFNHDQISIPKAGASRDDVLTQRRIIASDYDYFVAVGFSYTFGSIYNSQVHPTYKGLNYSISF